MAGTRTGSYALVASFLLGVIAAALTLGSGSLSEAASGPAPEAEDGGALEVSCDLDVYRCALAEDVLQSFPYPWATLGYSVRITEPPDDWMRGRTVAEHRRIELFVREDTTANELSATFAHEVGHALHQHCDDAVLELWRERRDLAGSVPDYVQPPHDYGSVAEDFAEAFRQYLGFGASLSTVGDPLEERWLQLNADLFLPICDEST